MAPEVETLQLDPSEGVPNNPTLPTVLRHGVESIVGDPAACEELFKSNDWGGTWRNGVYPFHHFHSDAHEALGVTQGEARILLGGVGGVEVTVVAGDVAVLPAGVGHKCEEASEDLLIVGAYPAGQEDFDLRRGDPAELEEVRANIANVPLPETDPSGGSDGPLVDAWTLAAVPEDR